MLRASTIKRETGLNIPLEARPMFVRRYNQALKRTMSNDNPDGNKKSAKSSAMSFLRTRYKKILGKWHKRTNNKWVKL